MTHARTLALFELLMGVLAVLCGLLLATGLGGPILGMHRAALAGSPFDDFRIPGLHPGRRRRWQSVASGLGGVARRALGDVGVERCRVCVGGLDRR